MVSGAEDEEDTTVDDPCIGIDEDGFGLGCAEGLECNDEGADVGGPLYGRLLQMATAPNTYPIAIWRGSATTSHAGCGILLECMPSFA